MMTYWNPIRLSVDPSKLSTNFEWLKEQTSRDWMSCELNLQKSAEQHFLLTFTSLGWVRKYRLVLLTLSPLSRDQQSRVPTDRSFVIPIWIPWSNPCQSFFILRQLQFGLVEFAFAATIPALHVMPPFNHGSKPAWSDWHPSHFFSLFCLN